MLNFPAIGVWRPGQIAISWTESSRQIIPQVEEAIEQAWQKASARPGVLLFDGPMCRLEKLEATAESVRLVLSRTNYKVFLGTNANGQTNPQVRANPVGVSSLLITSDNFLLMGRRNSSVALYPNHVHPFAGSMEPAEELDAFGEAQRELWQELSVGTHRIKQMSCIGIAEEPRLNHIELVFSAELDLSRKDIESRCDKTEHTGVWSSQVTQSEVEAALDGKEVFTPFGRSALLLWGRLQFGDEWLRRFNR